MKIKDNTIGSLQRYVAKKLEPHFSEREVRMTVALLFSSLLKMDRADIILQANQRVTESEILQFYTAIESLKKGVPLQYILGETEFFGLKIKVSPGVLIPRPETEELVEWIANSINNKSVTILDIGTGSGCIALALKSIIPEAKIWGYDRSEKALEIAQENAHALNLDIALKKHNILTENIEIPTLNTIVSNPPYIPQKEKKMMQKNVLEHEPEIALFVENHDPLIFYRVIAQKAWLKLENNGLLFFEIHEDFGQEIRELLEEIGFKEIEIKKDMQGKERMIKAVKKC